MAKRTGEATCEVHDRDVPDSGAGGQAEVFTKIGDDVPIDVVASFAEAIGYNPNAVHRVVVEIKRVIVHGVVLGDDGSPATVVVDGQRRFDRFRNVHRIAR